MITVRLFNLPMERTWSKLSNNKRESFPRTIFFSPCHVTSIDQTRWKKKVIIGSLLAGGAGAKYPPFPLSHCTIKFGFALGCSGTTEWSLKSPCFDWSPIWKSAIKKNAEMGVSQTRVEVSSYHRAVTNLIDTELRLERIVWTTYATVEPEADSSLADTGIHVNLYILPFQRFFLNFAVFTLCHHATFPKLYNCQPDLMTAYDMIPYIVIYLLQCNTLLTGDYQAEKIGQIACRPCGMPCSSIASMIATLKTADEHDLESILRVMLVGGGLSGDVIPA